MIRARTSCAFVASDLSLEGSGNKHVEIHREELHVRDARHTGEAFERARRIPANVLDRSGDVDAVGRYVAAADIRYRDDPAPRGREGLRGHAADVAKTLDRDTRLRRVLSFAPKHLEGDHATPRPVASVRPREPPSSIGFPVTTSGGCLPVIIVTVSTIHAMVCSSVFTSGAGMSCSGPMIGRIAAM
jgi:hypothetical protein